MWHVIAAAFDQAQARDPQHRRCWVVLVDGARHQLDLIQAEAERRGVTIHIVLDLVHVIEKLWAASRCFHAPADPAAEDWIAVKAARVLRGCGQQAADEIRAEADHRKLTGDQRTAADRAWQYLNNNADFVYYDLALAAGWPIASGVIEGAAHHLIADRLDITDSRWRSQAPRLSSTSAPSSATTTSRPTGTSIPEPNSDASIPPPTRPTTNSPPEQRPHRRGCTQQNLCPI